MPGSKFSGACVWGQGPRGGTGADGRVRHDGGGVRRVARAYAGNGEQGCATGGTGMGGGRVHVCLALPAAV